MTIYEIGGVSMKRSSLALKIGTLAVISVMALSMTACGGSKKKTKSTDAASTEDTTTAATTAVTTTTIPTYSGPSTNDIEISWTEVEIEGGSTVKYVNCTEDYINVRKGPGIDYEVVAKLANNMQVVVVATSGDWYKTQDGYYISAGLVSDTPAQ